MFIIANIVFKYYFFWQAQVCFVAKYRGDNGKFKTVGLAEKYIWVLLMRYNSNAYYVIDLGAFWM